MINSINLSHLHRGLFSLWLWEWLRSIMSWYQRQVDDLVVEQELSSITDKQLILLSTEVFSLIKISDIEDDCTGLFKLL